MLNALRPAIGRVADPLAVRVLRAGVGPDAVTLAGTVGVVAGSLVFFTRGMFLVGTVVVFFSVLTDMLDGAMARRLDRRSVFGAWLDSTCDRLADAAVFSGLVLWFMGDGDDRLLAGVALFCLVAGSLVSYAKARAEGLGMQANVGIAERADRLVAVLVTTGLVGWFLPEIVLTVVLTLLAVASFITVVQRMLMVRGQALATPFEG